MGRSLSLTQIAAATGRRGALAGRQRWRAGRGGAGGEQRWRGGAEIELALAGGVELPWPGLPGLLGAVVVPMAARRRDGRQRGRSSRRQRRTGGAPKGGPVGRGESRG